MVNAIFHLLKMWDDCKMSVHEKQIKCAYCGQLKSESEIWGYSEGEDKQGNVVPEWICNECHKDYEGV
jgi:transposase-like protein